MFESWSVGVIIRATSNLGRVFGSAAASTAQLNRVVGATQRSTAALQRQQLALRAESLKASATIAGGIGAVSGAIMGSAVESAGQFDLGMRVIQNATGATTSQLAKLARMIHDVSDVTAQSSTTIQAEMITAATSGLNSFKQLSRAFPSLARAVDVLWIQGKASGRSFDVGDLTRRMVQASHMFQAYSPEQLVGTQRKPGLLDWLVKLQQVQPEGLERVITQMRYFVPMGHALGMTTKQTMELLGVMGQTGFLQGKGGTSVANAMLGAITASTLTDFRQRSRIAALTELGILGPGGKNMVVTPQGTLDWDKFNRIMSSASTRLPEATFVRDLHNALNQQATYLMTAVNTPAVRSQMQRIDAAFARLPGVQGMFGKLSGSLPYQQSRAWTTLKNALQDIGMKALPVVIPLMRNFANVLGDIDKALQDHPLLAKGAAFGLTAVTFGSFAAAGIQLVRFLGAMRALSALKWAGAGLTSGGIPSALGKVSGFFSRAGVGATLAGILRGGMIGRALTVLGFGLSKLIPVVGWVSAIVAGVSAIAFVLKHLSQIINWWNQHKAQIGYAIGYAFGAIARLVVQSVQKMFQAVAGAVKVLSANLPDIMLAAMGNTAAMADLAGKFQRAYLSGLKQYGGPGFLQSMGSGASAGFGGRAFALPPTARQVHGGHTLEINNSTIHLHGVNSKGELFDALLKQANVRLNSQGTHREVPWYSSASVLPTAQHAH